MEYDIEIHLSSDVGQALASKMLFWKNMKRKLVKSTKFSGDHTLAGAHLTTKHRLEVARVFLSILNAGYEVESVGSVKFLIRTMADSIFVSLAGALDSLSFEINQVYKFEVEERKIQIDHHSRRTEPNCIRCKLDETNDELSRYLNERLPREPIPQIHWYSTFTNYKNYVKHRLMYMIHEQPGKRIIPDDPSTLKPPYYDANKREIIDPNYAKDLELKQFCQLSLDRILCIVEKTCEYLYHKV
jgi:hypothetical protein